MFYSRQLEIPFENAFFHWLTNRALRSLIDEKHVLMETRKLDIGSEMKLAWYLVLAAFARRQFLLIAEEASGYRGVEWASSGHDLDFVFEKDGRGYTYCLVDESENSTYEFLLGSSGAPSRKICISPDTISRRTSAAKICTAVSFAFLPNRCVLVSLRSCAFRAAGTMRSSPVSTGCLACLSTEYRSHDVMLRRPEAALTASRNTTRVSTLDIMCSILWHDRAMLRLFLILVQLATDAPGPKRLP